MSFNIVIEGVVIEDEQELREQLVPLMLNPSENIDELVNDLMGARTTEIPSSILDQWVEREPGVTGVLAYEPTPQELPTISAELIEKPVQDQLSTVAATGLIAGLEEFINFQEDTGLMLASRENPPSVEQAGEIVKRLFMIDSAADGLKEFSSWNMGSLIDSFKEIHGEEFSVTQFCAATEQNYNTVQTALTTYQAFRDRRYKGLSYTHHKEAISCKVEAEVMHEGLELSQTHQLTCAQQRKLFSFARNAGGLGGLTPDEREHKDMLLERIMIKEANKNYLFFLITDDDPEGSWYRWRGVQSSIPEDASPVFCIDLWEDRSGGSTSEIKTYSGPVTDATPATP